MCWNAEVSLNTFAFGIFILGMVIYNNTYTQYKIIRFRNEWMYLFLFSLIKQYFLLEDKHLLILFTLVYLYFTLLLQ